MPTAHAEGSASSSGQRGGAAKVLEAWQQSRRVSAQGLVGAARGHLLRQIGVQSPSKWLCITPDEESADSLASDLAFFGAQVLRLPSEESSPYERLSPNNSIVSERMGALFHLRHGAAAGLHDVLVCSIPAIHHKVIPPGLFGALSARVKVNDELELEAFGKKLTEMGFHAAPLVEDAGTFSIRGGIVDVYSPLHPQPVRLELFGDTVESIRSFDPETQRTLESLEELILSPARELLFNDATRAAAEANIRAAAEETSIPTAKVRERLEQIREGLNGFGLEALWPAFFSGGLATIFDYLPFWTDSGEPVRVYLDDPMALERAAEEHWSELEHGAAELKASGELFLVPNAHALTAEEVSLRLEPLERLEGGGLSLSGNRPGDVEPIALSYGTTQDLRQAILTHHGEEGALSPLIERLERWREMQTVAVLACSSPGQVDRLKRLLQDRNVRTAQHSESLPPQPGQLYDPGIAAHLFVGQISQGFVDGQSGLALISDAEIFGAKARRKIRARRQEDPFSSGFKDLKEGDLVVHTDFGIARYNGLTTMEVGGIPGDFLILEFAGKDKVYLPVGRMRLVQKFTGGDPTTVTLDKLGTTSWEKTKKRVKENLLKMAAELLQLYAARKAHPGTEFHAPDAYFRQFEADFEFEETPDQQKAIDDVISDMIRAEPMDRLVCGDVGYGKTEVAMRAAFKAVQDKKQVAVLVPTTVLAQQHFQSFRKRFADYPVRIEVVSSMRKPAEVRQALKETKEGRVDILIGTHKLLSGEVGFKELGLLVVDEEQRFGVKQKEKLKRLKTQVDVLTLTATPIPRTLHMSMSGVRDMSIIATAPEDRRAIRTFVFKYDPAQIRDAILREINRGGQVFFVHNRVESIGAMARELRELVPEATWGVAHGQMGEGELEKVMADFIDRKYQVLLCTAIIESGIDISSANTMIVNRADTFGLAQLYQLRGRVGRSRERAYAYLLVPARQTITKDAQRRLEVLQAFTELGAGFSVASHDMEIRGAGNLLGPDQSGSIEAIGFDLYAQLLDEAVREMRGEPPRTEVEPDVNLPLPALIPDDYVPDVHQRLVFYKRFSQVSTEEELGDLRAELVDRFGDLPDEVDTLSETTSIKIEMRSLRLRALEVGAGRLSLTLGTDALLDGAKLAAVVQRSRGGYRLTPDLKLTTKIDPAIKGQNLLAEAKRVLRDVAEAAIR